MDMHLLDVLLFSLSIGWIVAYIDAIRIGFKEKTYCIPFVAIALNITWETIGAAWYIKTGTLNYYSLTYAVWGIIDILIVTTYFKFGYAEFYRMFGKSKKTFVLWSLLFILCAGAWQLFYSKSYDTWLVDTAFNQTFMMSTMFIYMHWVRRSSKGQSMLIAIAKCIGTLGPTLQGYVTMHDSFMAGIGTVCFILDIAYIILLYRTIRAEKAMVKSPKGKKKQNT